MGTKPKTAACACEMNAAWHVASSQRQIVYWGPRRRSGNRCKRRLGNLKVCTQEGGALSASWNPSGLLCLIKYVFFFFLAFFPLLAFGQGRTESVAAHYCKSSAAGGECTTDSRRCLHAASGAVFMKPVRSGRCPWWWDRLKKWKGQRQGSVACCGYSSRQLERFDEGFCTMQLDFAEVVWPPRGCLPQQTFYWFTRLLGVFAVSEQESSRAWVQAGLWEVFWIGFEIIQPDKFKLSWGSIQDNHFHTDTHHSLYLFFFSTTVRQDQCWWVIY